MKKSNNNLLSEKMGAKRITYLIATENLKSKLVDYYGSNNEENMSLYFSSETPFDNGSHWEFNALEIGKDFSEIKKTPIIDVEVYLNGTLLHNEAEKIVFLKSLIVIEVSSQTITNYSKKSEKSLSSIGNNDKIMNDVISKLNQKSLPLSKYRKIQEMLGK